MSTEETYYYRLKQVKDWARREGFTEDDAFPPEPEAAMPEVVALGALEWGSWRWAPSYLEGIKTAVGDWHTSKGLASPMDGERAQRVLKAAKKRALSLGHKGRGAKAPLTKELLEALVAWLDVKAAADGGRKRDLYARDGCWMTLGFFGLLRRAELGALRMEDVVVDPAQGRVRVFIRRSKTDPGQGAWVWLAWKTDSGYDIGKRVQAWLDRRWRMGARGKDPVFTAWDKSAGQMTHRAVDAKGQALAAQLKRHLAGMAAQFHMDINVKDYASHSMRRGGANAMKEAGWAPERIQEHGRWTSDCYKRYLERAEGERTELTSRM